MQAKGEPKTLPEAIAAASKVPVFAYDPSEVPMIAYDPSAKTATGPSEMLQRLAKNSITAAKTKGVELKVGAHGGKGGKEKAAGLVCEAILFSIC